MEVEVVLVELFRQLQVGEVEGAEPVVLEAPELQHLGLVVIHY